MKVKTFSLGKMKNLQLLGYSDDVQGIILETLPESERDFTQEFTEALNQLHSAMQKDRELFGEQVREADCLTDRAWIAINTLLQLNMTHFVPEIAQAAKEVNEVFSKVVNPTQLNYGEEYALLKILISQLDEIAPETTQTAGVDLWIQELKRRVDVFNELRLSQALAKTEVDIGYTKRCRDTLTVAHRELINILNVLLKIRHSPSLERFAQALESKNQDYRTAQKIAQAKDNSSSPSETSSES